MNKRLKPLFPLWLWLWCCFWSPGALAHAEMHVRSIERIDDWYSWYYVVVSWPTLDDIDPRTRTCPPGPHELCYMSFEWRNPGGSGENGYDSNFHVDQSEELPHDTAQSNYDAVIRHYGHYFTVKTRVDTRLVEDGACFGITVNSEHDADIKFLTPCAWMPPPPPPPSHTCSLPETLDISFGKVPLDLLDKRTADKPVSIDCAEPDTVMIKLQTPSITLQEGLTSTLSIHGLDISENVLLPLKAGHNPVDMLATLHTSGKVDPGLKSGSGIVVLSYE